VACSGRQRDPVGGGIPRSLQILRAKSEGDLAMTRDGGRPLGVETPEAVSPSLPDQVRSMIAEVAFEVATLHAARMTRSSDSVAIG